MNSFSLLFDMHYIHLHRKLQNNASILKKATIAA